MSKHTSQDNEHNEREVAPPGDTEKQNSDIAGLPQEETAAEAGGSDGETEASDPAARIVVLESQLVEAKDQYLRKAAEFENFRKRITREKQEAIDFANQTLLLDLIPIIDDFERAIKSAENAASNSPEFTSLCEGIGMIEKRLVSQLENKWGLIRFDSAGTAFDPARHEAIMMEKSNEISEPTVAEDFLKGYMLKDRVVRSAKVKVLMPAEAQNPGDAAPQGEEV
jgi:molecular chaperone GrpE